MSRLTIPPRIGTPLLTSNVMGVLGEADHSGQRDTLVAKFTRATAKPVEAPVEKAPENDQRMMEEVVKQDPAKRWRNAYPSTSRSSWRDLHWNSEKSGWR